MTTQHNLSRSSILAGSIVHRLTLAAARLVALRHELQTHETEDGTAEPCIYAMPLAGSPWWMVDAWSDGDCLHLQALGWTGEVHYKAARTHQKAPDSAA